MKERLVKGTSLVQIVRTIRSRAHERALPELGAWEQDLLRKRISPTTWYSLTVYDSLLQTVHRYILDGSEAAAQNMGRTFARILLESRDGCEVLHDRPLDTLHRMAAGFRHQFNFSELSVAPYPHDDSECGARLFLTGFPDMSAALGHAIIGLSRELVELAGAKDVSMRLEERPWMHHNVLRYTLEWSQASPRAS